MPDFKTWETLSQRLVYKNQWILVREDRFLLPNGQAGLYGVIEIRPSIGVVAVNAIGEVALIGQYRYPSRRYTWEIPRGGSLEGETNLLLVAQRELREEAGVEAAHWQTLGAVDVCNGVTTDVQHLFFAKGLTPVHAEPDPEEVLALRWVPALEATRMAVEGEITEVCSVAALLRAEYLKLL